MTTRWMVPALALAALSLSACGPRTEAGNTATDTVTLNEADAAGIANSDAFEASDNAAAADNATAPISDNAALPAGNGL